MRTNDPYPTYPEEDHEFVHYCDLNGEKTLALNATHYIGEDPDGTTRIFEIGIPG